MDDELNWCEVLVLLLLRGSPEVRNGDDVTVVGELLRKLPFNDAGDNDELDLLPPPPPPRLLYWVFLIAISLSILLLLAGLSDWTVLPFRTVKL